MNLIQRIIVAVGLLLICIPVLFPSWQISYSNHAGLDRWTPSQSGSPIQEQLWELESKPSIVERRFVFNWPKDIDLKDKEMKRDVRESLGTLTKPVEQPWQFVSDVSGQILYHRMIVEVLSIALVVVCLTLVFGLLWRYGEKKKSEQGVGADR